MRSPVVLAGLVAVILAGCGAPVTHSGGSGGATASSGATSGTGSSGGSGGSACAACSLSHATASCTAGACAVGACDLGWNDCDGVAANGCEMMGPCELVNTSSALPLLDTASLVIDDASVYYTTAKAVMKVSKSGGVPVAIAASQPGPGGLAVAGGYVFWTTPMTGGVARAGTDGSGLLDLNGSNGTQPLPITADATGVYWADVTSGDVWQTDHDGGNVVHLAAGEAGPDAIAVDAARVYWTSSTSGDVRMAAKGAAMSPTTLVGGASPTSSLASSPTAVYWTVGTLSGMAAVLTSPKASPAAATFAADQGWPWRIVVDATDAYWLDTATKSGSAASGTVMKKSLSGGGSAITLAPGRSFPRGLAVDDAYVYWIDAPLGTVWKTAKAPSP